MFMMFIHFLSFTIYIFRHLAVDFQLFIIGLIAYFIIRKRSWKIKCGTLLLLLAIGIISPIFHILQLDLEGVTAYSPEYVFKKPDKCESGSPVEVFIQKL